jgi:WD40 repeat protein
MLAAWTDPAGFTAAAFSADGTKIATVGRDRIIRLWDSSSGRLNRTLDAKTAGPQEIHSVALSHDGQRLLVGGNGGLLVLWDASSGRLERPLVGHDGWVASQIFSPDGHHAVSAGLDGTIRLWDLATGNVIRTFEKGHVDRKGEPVGVTSVAFSDDGTLLVSGGEDLSAVVWHVRSGQKRQTFKASTQPVAAVGYSPDGAQFLSIDEDLNLRLWASATGELLQTLERPSHSVTAFAFAHGAPLFAAAGESSKITLWNTKTGLIVRSIDAPFERVTALALSKDGETVFAGGQGRLAILKASSGKIRQSSGKLVERYQGNAIGLGDPVTLAFSFDTRRAVMSDRVNFVIVDVLAGKILQTIDRDDTLNAAAFSRDGSYLVIGGGEVASTAATIEVWHVETGKLVSSVKDVSFTVWSVAFSPDGRSVIAGGERNMVARFSAATGEPLGEFVGHAADVSSVAVSHDGKRVLSGSLDGTIRIWDADSGTPLLVALGTEHAGWAAITPSGFFDGARDGRVPLHAVRGPDVVGIDQVFTYLHRPDLVRELLKGDLKGAYKDAAFHLDLEKILDTGPAPAIEHLEGKTERAGNTIKLAVSIVDKGGGIGPRVIWKVNGQTQGRVKPEELKDAQGLTLGRFTLTETLRIDPGRDNVVELTAYNGKGLLATPPKRIVVPRIGPATAKERPRMFVLAIGVDEYRMQSHKLKYAVNDTLKFAKALEIVGSALFAEVKTRILTNKQVTEKAIASAFDSIRAVAKVGDVFVLYLAGHGKAIAGKYYYFPETLEHDQSVERHAIGQDKWEAWLAKVGHVGKSVLFIDTCFGGAAVGLVRGVDAEIETAMNHLRHASGQNLIAASRQAAYEGYGGHGVLTYALLEALHKADAGADDTVRISGLANYVTGRVPKITQELFKERQWPIHRLLGDFPLGIRQSVLDKIGKATTIPKTHTHSLSSTERVRSRASADAEGGRELTPGFQVRLVGLEGTWAAIARDGEWLGYVPYASLGELH